MGQNEIEEKYHLRANFLQNLSLRNSFPFQWRQSLTREFTGNPRVKYEIMVQYETLDHLNSTPKKWYQALLTTKKQEIKQKEHWKQELAPRQDHPLQIDWERIFTIPYSVTRETKMHSFQYRISHRLIKCHKYLIILTAKFFIHREKLFNQGRLGLLAFLGEARKRLHTESLACQLEGKTGKFRKFSKLYQALGGQAAAPLIN